MNGPTADRLLRIAEPRSILLGIDIQVDFVHPAGSLYVQGADDALTGIAALEATARQHGAPVVATMESHALGDAEISDSPDFVDTFPPHCLMGTKGRDRPVRVPLLGNIPTLSEDTGIGAGMEAMLRWLDGEGDLSLAKNVFDVFAGNLWMAAMLRMARPKAIVVYGFATDYCVHQALTGCLLYASQADGRKVYLVEDLCRPIDEAKSVEKTAALRRQYPRHFDIVTASAAAAAVAGESAP